MYLSLLRILSNKRNNNERNIKEILCMISYFSTVGEDDDLLFICMDLEYFDSFFINHHFHFTSVILPNKIGILVYKYIKKSMTDSRNFSYR